MHIRQETNYNVLVPKILCHAESDSKWDMTLTLFPRQSQLLLSALSSAYVFS